MLSTSRHQKDKVQEPVEPEIKSNGPEPSYYIGLGEDSKAVDEAELTSDILSACR